MLTCFKILRDRNCQFLRRVSYGLDANRCNIIFHVASRDLQKITLYFQYFINLQFIDFYFNIILFLHIPWQYQSRRFFIKRYHPLSNIQIQFLKLSVYPDHYGDKPNNIRTPLFNLTRDSDFHLLYRALITINFHGRQSDSWRILN